MNTACVADDDNLLVSRTLLLQSGNAEGLRRQILDYFHHTFSLYESLFECLACDEAFYARANPLRHPLIFYYGHTAVFFINKMNVAGVINHRVNPRLESLLAIGVDEMSWDDLHTATYDWPSVADVKAYRDATRDIVERYIQTCDLTTPVTWEHPLWIVLMGIEHERIHLETSSVLIRELPIELVQGHAIWSAIWNEQNGAPVNALVPIAGRRITLGRDRAQPDVYGWDNEFGARSVDVGDFAVSQFVVSNGEFYEFMQAGGYMVPDYWTDEGWRWAQFRLPSHPVFWVPDGDCYRYRAMLEIIDMPWDWPAEVNYLEAKAFCNWKAEQTGRPIRMPTEAEWHCLRALMPEDQPTWAQAPGNINLEHYFSPCPVDRFAGPQGVYDIIGNVWQWTETPIDGFEGFAVHPVYDDFSTPTFDGQHNIFTGGSWISTGNLATRHARYAFRRHFFQHAGFRYVDGPALATPVVNVYETDDMISQYLEFHYGAQYLDVPNFPVACAQACVAQMTGRRTERALDLGCATGRAAFELARTFAHVDAVDFSARLLQAPVQLQQRGTQRYVVRDEGDLVSYREVRLADYSDYSAVKDRIQFRQGDACNLAPQYTDYDLVFAGNLIDRLYDPEKFLQLIVGRIRPGGLLVLASPYTWLEDFTPRDKWLGGRKAATGENYTTLDGLRDLLTPQCRLLGTPQTIPFVIRETARKFQHTLSELTVWEKI